MSSLTLAGSSRTQVTPLGQATSRLEISSIYVGEPQNVENHGAKLILAEDWADESGINSYTGTAADDYIDGLSGDDTIDGAGGNDEIYGGSGKDRITGNTGAWDVCVGGLGEDVITCEDTKP